MSKTKHRPDATRQVFETLQGEPMHEDTRPNAMDDYPAAGEGRDGSVVLDPDSWSVIWTPRKGWFMGAPRTAMKRLPAEAEALIAAYVRLENEPAFRREMIDWLKDHKT